MKLRVLRLGLSAGLFLLLLVLQAPTKADSITYTYTGSGDLAGTSFTYVSPSGFLTYETLLYIQPTTASDLIFKGTDYGQLMFFNFASPNFYALDGATLTVGINNNSYTLNSLGTQTLYNGILDIEPTTTPEPASLVLLGACFPALIWLTRRRDNA